MNFLFFAALLLCVSAQQQQQSHLVGKVGKIPFVPDTKKITTKVAPTIREPKIAPAYRTPSDKIGTVGHVQLQSMIQVAQAENNAKLMGPLSRYGADLVRFEPHQQTGLLPGVFGQPVNAYQVSNAFDAQSSFHSPNFQPGGFQNSMSFFPIPFQGSGTLRSALQSAPSHLAPITVTHGTTQDESDAPSQVASADFGGFSATPTFEAYPQDRQLNAGAFQISQNLPGTHFPVTILPTANLAQSPSLPTLQPVNAAVQPGQHWPNFFGQNQGQVAPYRFEPSRTPLVNTYQTLPAPQPGAKSIYPILPILNEQKKNNEESSRDEDDDEEDEEEGGSNEDEDEEESQSHEDDDEDEEESKPLPQSFQSSIGNNWCDVNPLCKKQKQSSTDSVEQVTRVPVSDYWDHVRAPYQYPSSEIGTGGSELKEQKTKKAQQFKKINKKTNNNKELVPGYHHYNYEIPDEFLNDYSGERDSHEILTKTTKSPLTTDSSTTTKDRDFN